MFINLVNAYLLTTIIIITAIVLFISFKKKYSAPLLIGALIFTAILVVHIIQYYKVYDLVSNYIFVNICLDFTGILFYLVPYIFIDEVEVRRERISEVFEERYKGR